MDYFRSGIKVAILFIVSCCVLTYFVIHAGQVRLMGETQEFKLLFSSVGNLKLDSPVTYSGFKVGQVIQIRPLSPDERRRRQRDVEVTVRLGKEVVIRKDSTAEVKSLGFLGEKYIELSPGGMDSEALGADETLYGATPKELGEVIEHFAKEFDEMIPKIKDTLEKLHSAVESVDQVVQEIASERKVQSVLEGAHEVTGRINRILRENRKTIRNTLKNAEEFSGNLKEQLKAASPKIQTLLDQIDVAVKDMDALLLEARGLLKSNTPGIEKTIKNLEEASEYAKAFLKILKEEPWRLLSKPRQTPEKKGPKRGFSIYQSSKK